MIPQVGSVGKRLVATDPNYLPLRAGVEEKQITQVTKEISLQQRLT